MSEVLSYLFSYLMRKYEFTDATRELLPKLLEWYWKRYNYDLNIKLGVTLEDYEFMYSLWKNGVHSYDDETRNRLNRIRNIYLNTNQ
jgi:hypothetical protein